MRGYAFCPLRHRWEANGAVRDLGWEPYRPGRRRRRLIKHEMEPPRCPQCGHLWSKFEPVEEELN